MTTSTAIADHIQKTVDENSVVLFMKGTPDMPQCGFSSKVSQILGFIGIEYVGVNVLESNELRQEIKTFSDWPTIPQLYVSGEFVGGCDIVIEMTLSGELDTLLEGKGIAFNKEAAETIRQHNA
ncbi:MAG: Grx4 family monothiol glutaredoxin [Pseudomonadota bacterium]